MLCHVVDPLVEKMKDMFEAMRFMETELADLRLENYLIKKENRALHRFYKGAPPSAP